MRSKGCNSCANPVQFCSLSTEQTEHDSFVTPPDWVKPARNVWIAGTPLSNEKIFLFSTSWRYFKARNRQAGQETGETKQFPSSDFSMVIVGCQFILALSYHALKSSSSRPVHGFWSRKWPSLHLERIRGLLRNGTLDRNGCSARGTSQKAETQRIRSYDALSANEDICAAFRS